MERPEMLCAPAGTETETRGPKLALLDPATTPAPARLTVYRPGVYDIYTAESWAARPPGDDAAPVRLSNGCRAVYRGPIPRA
jgi:hypothetical protein